jgi:hypothetical protein
MRLLPAQSIPLVPASFEMADQGAVAEGSLADFDRYLTTLRF